MAEQSQEIVDKPLQAAILGFSAGWDAALRYAMHVLSMQGKAAPTLVQDMHDYAAGRLQCNAKSPGH